MPTRQLKPGLSHSKRYNRTSWPAQSLYTRLLMHVDDHARYDADAELLASVLFPFGDPKGRRITAANVETWLGELATADLILRYTVEGQPYLKIQRWTERVRAAFSRFPAPPCQQPAAVAGSCQQPAANAALPSSSPTSTSNPSPTSTGREIMGAVSMAEVQASRTRAGALLAQIRALEARKGELEMSEREELRKKRRALEELQKKQAAGEFAETKP